MNTLALPAPSLARHLARTIDGRSLTGIPGAWSTPIKRKPFKAPKRTPVPIRWSYNITGDGVTSRHRIWIVSTQHQMQDGKQCTVLGYYAAKNRTEARRLHLGKCPHPPKPYATTFLCMGVEP